MEININLFSRLVVFDLEFPWIFRTTKMWVNDNSARMMCDNVGCFFGST